MYMVSSVACLIGACALSIYGYSRVRTDYREYLPSYLVLEYGDDPVEMLGEDLAGAINFTYEEKDSGKIVKQGMYVGSIGGKNVTVSVKDTTSPIIDYPDSIWMVAGECDKYDILAECNISDVDSVDSVVNGSINFSKEGTYYAVISATDGSGNTTNTGIIKVNVVSDSSEVQESSGEETAGTDRDTALSESIEGYIEESSDGVNTTESESGGSTDIPVAGKEGRDYYDSLIISSVGIDTDVAVGGDQASIDSNDVSLFPQMYTPGSGMPILLGGHNTGSLSSLSEVAVGDVITLYWEGIPYNYVVEYSEMCTTSGSDLTDPDTGRDVLEYKGREVLQIYTCYGSSLGNERWVVKAVPEN